MSIPLTFARDDLLSRLRSMLPAAAKEDVKAMAAHRKDEQRYLKLFHAACRAALKWNYKTAENQDFEAKVLEPSGRPGRTGRYYSSWKESPPTCPVSRVESLNKCIAVVEASMVKRFTVQHRGKYRDIYAELTAHIDEPKGMC